MSQKRIFAQIGNRPSEMGSMALSSQKALWLSHPKLYRNIKSIHLLVLDEHGKDIIPPSVKLVAGRTGQEYNLRKKRKGAFWEDRYHATAVESE
jgi:hypothetical protein